MSLASAASLCTGWKWVKHVLNCLNCLISLSNVKKWSIYSIYMYLRVVTVAHSEKLKQVQYSKNRATLCFMEAPRNCDCSKSHHCDSLCWLHLASQHRTGFLPGLPQIPTPFSWMAHFANIGKWSGKGLLDTQTKGDCQEEARVTIDKELACKSTLDSGLLVRLFFSFFLIHYLLLHAGYPGALQMSNNQWVGQKLYRPFG